MNLTHITVIAEELHLAKKQVQATAALLEEGATVPFIARYRKEVTGSLDEVAVAHVGFQGRYWSSLSKQIVFTGFTRRAWPMRYL